MHFEGTVNVKVSVEKLWSFLMDSQALAQVLPGCEKFEALSEDHFKVTLKAGVSFVKGTLNMEFQIQEKKPPTYAKLTGRGQGMTSSVDIDAQMRLKEITAEEAMLEWTADARIGGLLANVGQRLLSTVAEKNVHEFFNAVKNTVEHS